MLVFGVILVILSFYIYALTWCHVSKKKNCTPSPNWCQSQPPRSVGATISRGSIGVADYLWERLGKFFWADMIMLRQYVRGWE